MTIVLLFFFIPASSSTQAAGSIPSMEVEVKFRLPDSAAHQHLSHALFAHHLRTHLQENLFFDGAAAELSSQLAVLLVRFYDGDGPCFLTLKAKATLVDGVSRVEGDQEEIDPSIGRACVAEPRRLADLASEGSSRIMKRVLADFGLERKGGALVCLGGFRNVRTVYNWKEGLMLELDETQYDFGTNYEVECETSDPEKAKQLLDEFLRENGIPYSYSRASKFEIFRAGKLPSLS